MSLLDSTRLHAAVVAIENYDTGALQHLNGPASDALKYVKWLLSIDVPSANISAFVNGNSEAIGHLRSNGVLVREPSEAAILKYFFEQLPNLNARWFFLSWGGHGANLRGKQLLYFSDSSDALKKCVPFEELLIAMKTGRRAQIRNQAFVVDACSSFITDSAPAAAGLAVTQLPQEREGGILTNQVALYAASPGLAARNNPDAAEGLLTSHVVAKLIASSREIWPDFESIALATVESQQLSLQRPWHYSLKTPRWLKDVRVDEGGITTLRSSQATAAPSSGLVVRDQFNQDLSSIFREARAAGSMARGNNPATCVALTGLPGTGKTELARRYARDNREHYAGVAWIRSATRAELLRDINLFIDLSGARDGLSSYALREVDEFHLALEARRGVLRFENLQMSKPWLLIFDNAQCPSEIVDFMPTRNAECLVTSTWESWDTFAPKLNVGGFSEEEAADFLCKLSRRPLTTEVCKLVQDLECVPVAVHHAASYLSGRPQESIEQYRQKLGERIHHRPRNESRAGSTRYGKSVYEAFSLLIDDLVASSKGAEGKSNQYKYMILAQSAFCSSNYMPLDLLVDVGGQEDLVTAVEELAERSLVETHGDSVSVKKITQIVMQEYLRENGDFDAFQLEGIRRVKNYVLGGEGRRGLDRRRVHEFLPHIISGLQGGDIEREEEEVEELLVVAAEILQSEGEMVESRPFADRAGRLSQRRRGLRHAVTADRQVLRGNAYLNSNNEADIKKANGFFNSALEIDRELFGSNSDRYARDVINLAISIAQLGGVGKRGAATSSLETLRSRLLHNGDVSIDVILILSANLALLYCEDGAGTDGAIGSLGRAKELIHYCLSKSKDHFGTHDERSLHLIVQAAYMYKVIGNTNEAQRLKALAETICATAPQGHPWCEQIARQLGDV